MKPKVLIIINFLFILFACNSEKSTKIDLKNTIEINLSDSTSNKLIKIGVVAMLSPKEALPAYEEIIKYIGKELNMKAEMYFTKDYATMNELVKTKKVLAAFMIKSICERTR